MRDVPSRATFAALTAAASDVAPSAAVGVSRRLGGGQVSILIADTHGIGELVLPDDTVPDVVMPTAGPPRVASIVASDGRQPFEWYLGVDGVRHLVSVAVPGVISETRFWIGLTTADPPVSPLMDSLEHVAHRVTALLNAELSPDDAKERHRRLELAAGLLPALTRALDVREVFDRLSAISRDALPHDMLMLGLFNDDLTTLTLYAQTRERADLGRVLQQPYPPAFTRAWDFDILDDRWSHPLERDRPPSVQGVRSAVRLAIRLDDRIIGGLAFNAREPGRYTSADVTVGRRLADQVAVALSHQRMAEQLAEQARHNEELRARTAKSELLDELLASITSSAELPAVFDRISNMTQKVLEHDALFLAVPLPNRRDARVYAKTSKTAPFPELVPVPPALIANPDWEYDLVDDLRERPDQQHLWTTQHGYRSTLRVPIRLDNEFVAGLNFASYTPGRYTIADVQVARRIADRLALTFARDRGAALLKRADEATERAARLEARVRELTEELDSRTGFRRVVGQSPEWRQVLTQTTQVAATATTVLLLGESGTGKEVVARFLHRASSRNRGPFVALNCAALPEQLLEAELFGYERGAYTGATQSKPGQLEQSAGGTLFLDEVAEMSPSAQAKFLRVLQEREFQRLGGTRVLRTDARIVAATNRDLQRAMALGQFREDLYYRLNVFAIRLPPLRNRRADIVPLSEAFLSEISRGLGRAPSGISRDARQHLLEYHWPGNVRELRNALERAAILCDGGLITSDHLGLTVAPAPGVPPKPSPAASGDAAPSQISSSSATDLQAMERAMIDEALRRARFNKSKAAKALGLTRQQLYVRMRKYGIN